MSLQATLIDSHCHLTSRRLAGQLDDVLERATQAGVGGLVCSASSVPDSAAAAIIAAQYPYVYSTAGVHPHEAEKAAGGYLDDLAELCGRAKVVAVGEIGLDYHYDHSPRDVQRRVFAEQLDLARRLGKPVVVHTREAFDDTLAVIREAGVDGSRIVFHSFTEGPDAARRALDLGSMVSFSGIVTFQNAPLLRESAAIVPADRILVETDAPWLSPEPMRHIKDNEPAYVVHVAQRLAMLRHEPPEQFFASTTANARRFFGI